VEPEPLDYASSQIRQRKRISRILPFVPLTFGLVLTVWDFFCILFGGLAASSGPMTAEDAFEANLFGRLALSGVVVGLIIAIFVGAAVAIRRHEYGPIAKTCAILGIALCVLPLVAFIYLGILHLP
jgi:hypothetical protein